jgi:hypothetical protein
MQIKQIETFEAPHIDILQNRVNKFLREDVKYHPPVKMHYNQSVILPKKDEFDTYYEVLYTAIVEYNIETADEETEPVPEAAIGGPAPIAKRMPDPL